VDAGTVPEMNFKDVRPYLELPHFNAEAMSKKNSAAVGLTNFVVNIVGYRDIVVTVEPKKAKAAAAAAEAAEATAKKGRRREAGGGAHRAAQRAAEEARRG